MKKAKRKSVMDAIANGDWTFEPKTTNPDEFQETDSLPGSEGKIHVMAQRAKQGLPIWHPEDRLVYNDKDG